MSAIKKEKQLSPFEQKLNDFFTSLQTIPTVEKMLFIHHLQIMIKAGLSIVDGLRILSEETENKKLRKIIGEIKSEVETGKQFSDVLHKYPKLFPAIYVSMIAAGEMSGKIEEALTQVYNQMKKNHELTARVRGAMIYPAVISIAMIGVAAMVVFYILPQILSMFTEVNAELPLSTRVLVAIVTFAQNWWWLMLIFLVGLIVGFFLLLKNLEFKRKIHKLNLSLPIGGKIIKKINLARFSLTLSSLLQSSIPIIDAIKISADVVGNYSYKDALTETAKNLERGESLSLILSRYPKIFPPMVTEMIMVGEQTGRADEMLSELSEYYGNEVDTTMKNFSTIIEPVIILVLGLGVAGIAVSVIMPMYSMAQNF